MHKSHKAITATPLHLLDLLYHAHRDLQGMYVEVRDWSRREGSNVLVAEVQAERGVRMRWLDGGPDAAPIITDRRIWFEPPHRVRVELVGNGVTLRAAARNGGAWWRWDRDDGESAGDVRDGAALPAMLDLLLLNPSRILSTTWLTESGTGSLAGRSALVARGTQKSQIHDSGQHMEFAFDLEHGTPLRIAAFESGEMVSSVDVTTVDYRAAPDPALFKFERLERLHAAGALSRPPARRPRRLAMNQAARASETSNALIANYQTIWLTGLPGAGKTTVARATERLLHQLGVKVCVLDGDHLRQGLSSDLGLTREDRGEQARRVAHIAALLADSGVLPIVALVSPYAEDRDRARAIHDDAGVGFIEVWIDTPLDVCIERDPKGLYAAAPAREVVDIAAAGAGLTGVHAPYQVPVNADLRLVGYGQPARVAAMSIVDKLAAGITTPRVIVAS